MKKLLLSTLFIVALLSGNAQADTAVIKANVMRYADSMTTAFKQRNWKAVVRLSPASLIELSGGEDALVNMMEQMMQQVPDTSIKEYGIGPVLQLVQTPSDWQCVVMQHMKMEINGVQVTMNSPLIGQSLNGGASWTFFDSKGDRATAEQFLPTVSTELILPKLQQEVVDLNQKGATPNTSKTATAKGTPSKKPVAKAPIKKAAPAKKKG